jgi:hypothetical protein
MTPQRLQQEIAILEKYFPRKYKFENLYLDNELLDVGVKTQSGNIYRLNIKLKQDYPSSMPQVFVVYPTPLKNFNGEDIGAYSHSFHTLEKRGNDIEICHYKPNIWNPNFSLFRIIMKARIWLECYDQHKATGRPIDDFLKTL